MRLLFNEKYYLKKYGDRFSGDAYNHYISEGWKKGYKPNVFVDPLFYSKHNNIEFVEPLSHIQNNWRKIKSVSPAFYQDKYLQYYPDVALASICPLEHFLRWGLTEGRLPGFLFYELPKIMNKYPDYEWDLVAEYLSIPIESLSANAISRYNELFDETYYSEKYHLDTNGLSLIDHYTCEGYRYSLSPNPFFDVEWYKSHHNIGDMNPLLHYVVFNNRPNPFFYSKSYAKMNPGCGGDIEAFSHFVSSRARENNGLGVPVDILGVLYKLNSDFNWSEAGKYNIDIRNIQINGELFYGDFDNLKELSMEAEECPNPVREADLIQLEALKQRCLGKKLISFDIWDTLLRRDCDPDEVKLYAANVLLDELRKRNLAKGLSSVEIYKLRQYAEFIVADENYEYMYSHMIRAWVEMSGIFGNDVDEVIALVSEAELRKEMAVTRVDPTIYAVLRSFPKIRKIAISDFYLPLDFVKKILSYHGIDSFLDKLYISCDHMKTKREGALYDFVLSSEGVKPQEVIHIGDNINADAIIPKKKNIDVYYYIDDIEEERKRYYSAIFNGILNGDRKSLCKIFSKMTSSSLCQLSVVFGCYALYILKLAEERKVDKVYFSTREGLFFKNIYDLLVENDALNKGNYPASVILEVSRRSTFAASLRRVSLQEMMRIWSLYSEQSMSSLASSLNLSFSNMKRFCDKHNININEKIKYPWKDNRVKSLFTDHIFLKWVKEECLKQRKSLWQYLEKIGFEPGASKRRLMVDIGWRGSIQDNIAFIVNGDVEGIYMALYEYLAEQPTNAIKYGFMMDHNKRKIGHLGEFSALEFICNGSGGSVVSYKNSKAVKEVINGEERVVVNDVIPVQEKIIDQISKMIPDLCMLPLDVNALGEVARLFARSYLNDPDPIIADMFQKLEHNETFGVGDVQIMSSGDTKDISKLSGASFHNALQERTKNARWPEAWIKSTKYKNLINKLNLFQIINLPRVDNYVKTPRIIKRLGNKISIFAPKPIKGSGGHRTIYNLARALDVAGFSVHLFSEEPGAEYWYAEQELAGSNVILHDRWFSGVIPDAAIATIQYSSPYLSEFFGDEVRKFYLIQDLEAQFNPLSDAFVRGENSYTEGHFPLCIGRWLTHVLHVQYGTPAASAGLGVDTKVYHPLELEEVRKRDHIAVLYQPEKWRRLPELSLEALSKVMQLRPETEITFYGSDVAPNVSFKYTHLGLISNIDDLNKLYNSAKIGLCISLTNPSRIPFEMMAAGCVPVDVYRYNNLFDYEDGTGVLAYQSADSLAAAMLHLLNNKDQLKARRIKCIETGAKRTLIWEKDALVNSIEYVLEGGDFNTLPVPEPAFNEAPFVAERDMKPPVISWCKWQKQLAKNNGG